MDNQQKIDLSRAVKEHLSEEIIAFTQLAGALAEKRGMHLYLVGGAVRDILLERFNTDIDLAVEGDAIKLAEETALVLQAKIITHPRFKTATLKWGTHSADMITARAETYARPGALPQITSGSIKADMARRDFSINAMAISLSPVNYGELYDPYGGRQDLEKERICVLHDQSFTDDATRIWRAVRYEQRLDFCIEPVTLLLINRDIDMLKTVSGDRIRHELELALKEEEPERILRRADELGILAKLNPYLKGDRWLEDNFAAARENSKMDLPSPHLYLALLVYRLIPQDANKLISYLRLPKAAATAVRDTQAIKARIKELTLEGQSPSVIYSILHGFCTAACEANVIASSSSAAAEHIELYENVLKHVRPTLTGDDLKKLGVPKGPRIKEALQKLLEAKLDGLVETKADEEQWIKERQAG